MSIMDLSREVGCDVITVRRWIKATNCQTFKAKAKNNKMAMCITDADCENFKNYWKEKSEISEGYISVPALAKECCVDRKIISIWIERNYVPVFKKTNKNGPVCWYIWHTKADEFRKVYNTLEKTKPISQLLKKYKCDWRVAERWAKREGKAFVKVKNQGSRFKKGLIEQDYEQLELYLKSIKEKGFLYMIQLIPEYNPNRIKFGFAYDVPRRLYEHQTTCPNAVVIASWPCLRHLEKQSIKLIVKNMKCKTLTSELYECDNLNALFKKAKSVMDYASLQSVSSTSCSRS